MRATKPAAAVAVAALIVTFGAVAPVAARGADEPPSSYVVTFDEGANSDEVLMDLERSVSLVITHRFDHAVKGAVVQTSEVPEEMAMVPGVATVERDVEIVLPPVESEPVADSPGEVEPEEPNESAEPAEPTDPQEPEEPEEPEEPNEPEEPEEPEEPTDPSEPEEPNEPEEPQEPQVLWHLDRIDQRNLPLDNSFQPAGRGSGVTVYVVDSGISPHTEFGDRLGPGVDLVGDGNGTEDCGGHGTHVAGTIGGRNTGVANEVTLVPVRVFSCSGATEASLTIAAFDWIAQNHPAGTPAVVNFSVGGLTLEAEELAVRRLITLGITVVTAAGNDDIDACGNATGIKVEGSIVTGATGIGDSRTYFSNYGPCVDLFAPGDNVLSASIAGPDLYVLGSGTSMAAPHTAGAAAVLLGIDPWRTPVDVETALLADATTGVVGDPGTGSPDRLLYSDPNRTPSPANPTPAEPVPQVQAAVVEAPRSVATTAALAFTGGDPRAMLVLAILLIAGGAMASGWARRRQQLESAAAAAAAARLQRADGALQLVKRRRY